MPSAKLTFDDGTTQTITGASMQELARRASEFGVALEAPQEAHGTTAQAVASAVGGRSMGAIGNIAERLVNLPADIVNPLLRGALSPTGVSVHDSLPPNSARIPQIPRVAAPDGQTIAAAIETPLQAVIAGQDMSDAFRRRLDLRQQLAMDRPVATVAGETAVDAAMLVGLRSPARGGQAGGAFDRLAAKGVDGLTSLINPAKNQRGVRAAVEALAGSGASRSLAQGLGRVAETGLEGYITGVLQDGDPEEMAAVGAGMQAAGSVSNTVFESVLGKPGSGLDRRLKGAAGAVASGAVLFALLGELAPFDEDTPTEFLEDINSNFEKVASAGLLGLTVGLGGIRGSNSGAIAKFLPGVADALSTLPRAGIFSLYTASQTDPSITVAMQNASQLGASDSKRFVEILEGEDPASGLRDWMNGNARVNRILTAPDPRLADVPVRSE